MSCGIRVLHSSINFEFVRYQHTVKLQVTKNDNDHLAINLGRKPYLSAISAFLKAPSWTLISNKQTLCQTWKVKFDSSLWFRNPQFSIFAAHITKYFCFSIAWQRQTVGKYFPSLSYENLFPSTKATDWNNFGWQAKTLQKKNIKLSTHFSSFSLKTKATDRDVVIALQNAKRKHGKDVCDVCVLQHQIFLL